jgi:glycosyltransferase involved in cell wall biosynthesis
MRSFTVIVPALNEEKSLRPTVEALLKEIGPLATFIEVLVFDDASTDRTGEIADALSLQDNRIRVFHNSRRLNIGGIFKAGVKEARGDYLLLVPGDGEARIDELARGMCYLDRANLVVFYVTNPFVRSLARRGLSRVYVWVVNLLFSAQFLYTNGQNIFRTDILRSLPLRTDGFAYQTEAVLKSVWSGVDFIQVGIEIKPRESGRSKAITWKNFKKVAAALGQLWWEVRVKERHRYNHLGRSLGKF